MKVRPILVTVLAVLSTVLVAPGAAGSPVPAAESPSVSAPTTAAAGTAGALPPFRGAAYRVTAAHLPYSYRAGCPVPPSQLRMLNVSYYGFDGREHLGRMVVNASRAAQLIGVFKKLYERRFPIARMRIVDDYRGSDARSMAANNTSAFNCRAVTGGSSWSQHSYGTAIDINPVQNPYVSGSSVQPPAGRSYLNRANVRKGMITSNDFVVRTFRAAGWTWGGTWTSPKDYQHFSTNGR